MFLFVCLFVFVLPSTEIYLLGISMNTCFKKEQARECIRSMEAQIDHFGHVERDYKIIRH